MKLFTYDTSVFDFRKLLLDNFECSDLQNLHKQYNTWLPEEELSFSEESSTKFHEKFYEKLREPWNEFIDLYHSFIREHVSANVREGRSLLFQTLPSFRVHLPNEKAIHKVHYDGDEDHRHPPGEINVFLPMTDCLPNNTIWAESSPGKSDFSPMLLSYGEYAVWNGNECAHYNKSNTEELTRVSFDFRLLPKSKYDPNYKKTSYTSSTKFVIGEYYDEL